MTHIICSQKSFAFISSDPQRKRYQKGIKCANILVGDMPVCKKGGKGQVRLGSWVGLGEP